MCYAINPGINSFGPTHPSRHTFSSVKDDDKEVDLIHILNRLQRHTEHGPHCLRKSKIDGKLRCRFNFPGNHNLWTNYINSVNIQLFIYLFI